MKGFLTASIASFRSRSFLPFIVLLSAFSVACTLYLYDPLALQVLRNAQFDQYQRWHPRPYQETSVKIIDIDDQSLRRLGQWPWPRPLISQLIEKLHEAGASAIVFDVLFAEPDRSSPQLLLAHHQLPARLEAELARLPDHDQALAATLAGKPVVLSFASQNLEAHGPLPTGKFGMIFKGPAATRFLPGFRGAVSALPQLSQSAAGNGTMTFVPDSDGVVRRVPLLVRVGNAIFPSLSAEALRVSQNARNYETTASKDIGIERIRIGKFDIPTTAAGEAWVHFTKAAPQRVIPAWELLSGGDASEKIRGNIVLIGTSAQGLQDVRFSPLTGVIPGVHIHAQFIEQALTGTYLRRPTWGTSLEALLLLAGGMLVCLATLRFHALTSALLAAVVLALVNWAAWRSFVDHRLLLDAISVSLAIGLIYIAAGIMKHVLTERRQRWVRQAFSRYVSPNLVEHLVNNPDRLQLGGRRQTCSFVFTDLVGFTGLMEKSDTEGVVALLNDYLDEMIKIAFRHEGTLDRIVGDSVAIMFSAPVEQVDHPARALACALEMHRFASDYSEQLRAHGIAFGQTRIGVHCGEVVVGNFGGGAIFDYRALGDAVNTASRLEGLNQHIGTLVCVSGAVRRHCSAPAIAMRSIGTVILSGKSLPVEVFEPVSASAAAHLKGEDAQYETAFALMRSRDEAALPAFEELHRQRPQDGLVSFHLDRLRLGERSDLILMTSK